MSGPQLPAISHSLSEAASSLVYRIPELLRRLRDLQNEEAKLDAQARQLMGQVPKIKDRPSIPSHPIVSTPISKPHIRDAESTVDRGVPSTPPHIDPSIYLFLDLEKETLNMSRRKHQDTSKNFFVDGVVRISHVGQKQAQREDILGRR